MQQLPPALAALGAWPQFVTWFAEPKPDGSGKFNKFPCDWRTGKVVDAHDPQHWTTSDVALRSAPAHDRGHGCGAGFVFTDADPFFFLDPDKCYDEATGQWSPLAVSLCQRLGGAAVEVSHSGRGLHIIGRAAPLAHAKKNIPLNLELYTSGRFVALTGTHAQGDAGADVTAGLWAVAAEYFPPRANAQGETPSADWTTYPVGAWNGPPDDAELLRRAKAASGRSAAAVFTADGAPSFTDLWDVNADVLAAKWPGDSGGYDRSSADQALANHLAFWTGKDCARMERMMRDSGLARDKWDEPRPGGTILSNTILGACSFVTTVYTGGTGKEPVVAPTAPDVMAAAASSLGRTLRDPSTEFMGPHDQLSHFTGCYYDNMTGKIYSLPKNTEFDQSRFNVNYGGHLFVLDPAGLKTTPSAWEAFTLSRVNSPVVVDTLAFRPELPPGVVIRDGTRAMVNSYVPHATRVENGPADKWLWLIAKLLPDERDRRILLSYMAALVQNPGAKFQWWPVIQGTKGNGKSLAIASVLEYAVGHEYTHQVNAHSIVKDGLKFNNWIYRKLLLVFEEINVGDKRDFLEEIKTIVTGKRIPMEGKGQDQVTADNRANGVCLTNHKGAVPVTADERRWTILYTAQQSAEDLERDGLTSLYFRDLIDWLEGAGEYADKGANYGYACVCSHLQQMAIAAEDNPARLSLRAPATSSTEEALVRSFGRAEQEVLEAIEEGRVGFAGGWVSSTYLDDLLARERINVPRNQRAKMLLALGYMPHPALTEGRANAPVDPDGKRSRLFVTRDHESLSAVLAIEAERAYSAAQRQEPPKSVAEVIFLRPTVDATVIGS